MAKTATLNIIVPVYNERGSIDRLYAEVDKALDKTDIDWQITFVDDGSQDNSVEILHKLAKKRKNVNVFALSRNFGKEIALTAGLHQNTCDAVVMMDADLQHPPRYLKKFLECWRQGHQVVIGVRRREGQDRLAKKLTSKLYYKLINKVSEVEIVSKATDFRLLDKTVVDAFRHMPENNRITRGMIDWLGFERCFVEFDADDRFDGEATYTLRKLIKLAGDSLISMSQFPLQLTSYLGAIICLVFGSLGLFMLVSKYLFNDHYDFSGPASLAVLIIFLVGILLINIGFLGMYVANIHQQVKNRPLYVINDHRSIRNKS